MKKIVVILMMVLIVLIVGNQALAMTTWYLGGYGKQGLSWGNFDELIEGYNSLAQALGLGDFEMKELGREVTIYSIGNRWELSPRWEIELNTTVFNSEIISESQEKTIPLEEGGEKWLKAEGDIRYFMTLIDLSVVYRFRSSSRLTPFIRGGVTY